jgi:hypothetical protein
MPGDHFYTTDEGGESAASAGYHFEGTACQVYGVHNMPNSVPLFRWYNQDQALHFYTLDPNGEKAKVSEYVPEGIACYVPTSGDTVNFYRWVNPTTGAHFYTTDPSGELAPSSGFVSEGVACQVFSTPQASTKPF